MRRSFVPFATIFPPEKIFIPELALNLTMVPGKIVRVTFSGIPNVEETM